MAALPARLAPYQLEFDSTIAVDNGAVLATPGRVSVNPGSLDILFSRTLTGLNYAGPGTVGFLAGSIKYLTA